MYYTRWYFDDPLKNGRGDGFSSLTMYMNAVINTYHQVRYECPDVIKVTLEDENGTVWFSLNYKQEQ